MHMYLIFIMWKTLSSISPPELRSLPFGFIILYDAFMEVSSIVYFEVKALKNHHVFNFRYRDHWSST